MKIRKSSVMIIILLLMLFEIFLFPVKFYNYASYVLALVLFIYVIKIGGQFRSMWYVFLFPIAILLSTYTNYGYGSRVLFFAMIYGLMIVDVFYIIADYIKKESYSRLLDILRSFFLSIMILNDMFCILGIKFYGKYYLIGSKFRVVYIHCLVIVLLYSKIRGLRKVKLSGLAIYSIIISQIVDCSTGVVAVLVVWGMLMIKDILIERISGVKFIAILWGGITLIYVSLNTVLQIPSIQYFITKILGEDSSLTGRTRIYAYLTEIILKNPIWGYGHLNTIVEKIVGFGNAQNGTIKFLIDYGAIGLCAFIALVVISFYRLGKTSRSVKEKAYSFVVLITTLFICSIVEVSFNAYMYLALAVIAGLSINATKEGSDE